MVYSFLTEAFTMFILKLISYLLILTIWSCGEDFSGGNRFEEPAQREDTEAPEPSTFSTRLNRNLAVEGKKCRGDETTEVFGRGSSCLAGQYLVTIDGINTCSTSGGCTNLVVIPIIAELENIGANIPNLSVFEVLPKGQASRAQTEVLRSIYLNSDVNGNARVFFR